jgi:hypothetical protein
MPQPSEECWWSNGAKREAFMGCCVDCKDVGAVKRETNVNPNQAEFY